MNLTNSTLIVKKFIDEHTSDGLTLLKLAQQSKEHPWLVEIIGRITGAHDGTPSRFDKGGPSKWVDGEFVATIATTLLLQGQAEANQLILPGKIGTALAGQRSSVQGELKGRIRIGVRPSKMYGYAWAADFDEDTAPAAATQQADVKPQEAQTPY